MVISTTFLRLHFLLRLYLTYKQSTIQILHAFACGFRRYLLKILRELWSEESQDLPASFLHR